MSQQSGYDGFDEEAKYDEFPRGGDEGFGTEQGFNTWVRINDARWFTEEALADPTIRAFTEAPFAVSYSQFKSSHREAEWFIHKPHKAMTGQVEGIKGVVEGYPEDAAISTFVMNHEETLAIHITRSLTVADGSMAAQVIHKEGAPGG